MLAGVKQLGRRQAEWISPLTFLRLLRFGNRLETKMGVSVRGRVAETPAAEPSLVATRSSSGGRGDFDVSTGEADWSA